jgi:CheY-like chemotaxis protein
VTASSYEEAMQALNDDNAPVDILITDARMPDGNGIDLVRLAIERPDRPRACILMTGHLEEDDLARDLQDAGVKIIFKPFSLAAFYREVHAACDANWPVQPTPAPAHVG